MAAPITAVELGTAYGSITTTALMIPALFGTGDYVYLVSDYTIAAGSTTPFVYNPYKIVKLDIKTFDDGGTIKCLAADGVTAAVSATVGNAADTPTFFDLVDEKGNGLQGVHCSLVTDQAGMETLVGAEVSDWKTPTF